MSKLGTGQKVAGVAGIVLVIDLFLPWYSVDFGFGSVSANAFDTDFGWLGALVAIAGAVVLLLKALDVSDVKIGNVQAEQLALWAGLIGAVLILIQFLNDNDFTSFGIWLAIIASLGVAYGGFQASKDAGLEVPGMGGGAE